MSSSSSVLESGRTCFALAPISDAGVIIDAKAYYRAIHRGIVRAQRYVLMSGWQFDANVQLLRGAEAEQSEAPSTFLQLLETACNKTPELRVYLLAWKYSFVYALERIWFQKLRFTWHTHEHIHFQWDKWLPRGASHHQKLVVIDGAIAFAGGMDVCNSRWDGREHLAENELRASPGGRPNKPYHDVQAWVSGPAVGELERLFCQRWRHNTGAALSLPKVENPALEIRELTRTDSFPVRALEVGLSQTCLPPAAEQEPAIRQVRDLYLAAVASAGELIYIENQYFTSRSLTLALVERLRRTDRARLQIIIVLPRGGDSKKEKLALGEAQAHALGAIRRAAERNEHSFRAYYSLAGSAENGVLKPTFIHSKVLVVDDRLLSVGSANTTNRSFGLDSELNLSWEADRAEVRADIRRIRASLLAEHAGTSELDPFLQIQGLTARIDALCRAGCRLRPVELEPADDNDPLISLATDPESPVDARSLRDRVRDAGRAAIARLSRLDSKTDED
jgi:phosphatidylserine/phosphatidylglycerophosphate/cardiolipin synthase-like enzyme